MKPKEIIDIQTARRCLHFKRIFCDNEDCLNKCCPLNHFWNEIEKKKTKGEKW